MDRAETSDLPTNRKQFYSQYSALRAKFEAMQPELELTLRDPELDVEGYVVVWNTAIGRLSPIGPIGKGGTRVLPDLTLNDVKRLARAMAQKNAAAGLPLGGAKSGLRADPSDHHYETKFRRFVQLCAPVLAENGGPFGGFGYDIGGIPPLNAYWACEELASTRSFTGKPIELGGTNYDVEGIAGFGVAVAAEALLESDQKTTKGRRFSVQGVGAMGAAVIRYFSEMGGILNCVSDPKLGGTWCLPAGPGPALLNAIVSRNIEEAKALLKAEAEFVTSDPAGGLYCASDVLFPCALEDAVTIGNVSRLSASYVCEGANNAITSEAHEALFCKGVAVAPDIIANPGGIIAAYVELLAAHEPSKTGDSLNLPDQAKRLTKERIRSNVKDLTKLVAALGINAEDAADFLAYKRMFAGEP